MKGVLRLTQIDGTYGTALVYTREVEQSAYTQIAQLMNQPFVAGARVRIMPDVHAGMGCVIGTTMHIVDKVCPNLVGVDVGCGVLVAQLPIQRDAFDAPAFDRIVRRIPAGFSVNREPLHLEETEALLSQLVCLPHIKNLDRIYKSMGTLGGGNHFIEVAANAAGKLYLLIHSGSRNLGKQVAEHYQALAANYHNQVPGEMLSELEARFPGSKNAKRRQRELRRLKKQHTRVPDDLAYLEGALLSDYLHDMRIAQRFAYRNREVMAQRILEGLTPPVALADTRPFQTVHNYIDQENILRKGAVSARAGEVLVIPLNMRDGSLIVRGRGNPDWNHSAPHGAGRIMSRGEARRVIDIKDFERSMAGVYTTTLDQSTIDEAPMAYKPMADILAAIGDTAEVLEHIRPIYNFKSAGD